MSIVILTQSCTDCRLATAARKMSNAIVHWAPTFMRRSIDARDLDNVQRVERGMRGFVNSKTFPASLIGNPVNWLSKRRMDEVRDEERKRLKATCADPWRMAQAKDRAGVSDLQLRTVLREALPPRWAPSARQLLKARKDTTEKMQVSANWIVA